MRRLLLHCLLFCSLSAIAQPKKTAISHVKKGVFYQQKGNYDAALAEYKQALKIDKNNIYALSDISMIYTNQKKYKKAIKYCKKIIQAHPKTPILRNIYVQLGTCYDLRGQRKKSIKAYDQGLVLFPNYYLLHFNKGVTQLNSLDTISALSSFQKAAQRNPQHASSHYHIGSIEAALGHRIPSILALSRFLTIEPVGERAMTAENALLSLVNTTRQQNDSSFVIALSSSQTENNFKEVERLFSVQTVMDKNNPNRMTDEDEGILSAKVFKAKFQNLCRILKKSKTNNQGFYWDFYVPFFVQMDADNHINVFAHLVHLQQAEYKMAINDWFEDNEDALDEFSKWSKSYPWVR